MTTRGMAAFEQVNDNIRRPVELTVLTTAQVAALATSDAPALTTVGVASLSTAQLSNLTTAQLSAICANNDLNAVEVVALRADVNELMTSLKAIGGA